MNTNSARGAQGKTAPDDVDAFLAEVEGRASKATPGPIDVHRIDQHDGTIAYQLQQADHAPKAASERDSIGARVLTQYDDLDNPDARHDAEFHASAHADVPRLVAIARAQCDRLAKLEALLVRARKHWGPGASNEGCECDGCTIVRDIDAELPNAKDGAS